jgi:prepilin-type N-terminal cleavage/methylation domain-containing protein
MLLTNRSSVKAARRGFTLVEMLVVITIIAVLVSLSTGAIMKVRLVQQTNNTNTLVTKVDQAFQKKWLAVIETARTETPCALAQTWSNGDQARAKIIHIKLRLIQEFPVNFQEATTTIGGPGGLAPNQTYVRAFQGGTNGRSWQDQSSACLYLALKRQTRGIDFDPDTSLSSQEIADPVGDGVKEIVDGWRNPIIFVRFPGFQNPILPAEDTSALLNLAEFGGGAGARPFPPSFDPVDQEGSLANSPWVTGFSAGFQQNVHPLVAGKSFTLFPVISSSGVDGKTFSADDIYNFRLSAR